MSPHHGGPPDMPFDSEMFKSQKAVRMKADELSAHLSDLNSAQAKINQFPEGKAVVEDEGQSHFGIAVDPRARIIRIQFAEPVAWIGLDVESAKQLRDLLTSKISQLEN